MTQEWGRNGQGMDRIVTRNDQEWARTENDFIPGSRKLDLKLTGIWEESSRSLPGIYQN